MSSTVWTRGTWLICRQNSEQEWSEVSLFCCGEKTVRRPDTADSSLPLRPAAPLTQYQLSVLTATSQCNQPAIMQSFMVFWGFVLSLYWDTETWNLIKCNLFAPAGLWLWLAHFWLTEGKFKSHYSLVSPAVNYWAIIKITNQCNGNNNRDKVDIIFFLFIYTRLYLQTFWCRCLLIISRVTQIEVKSRFLPVLDSPSSRAFGLVINLSEFKIRIFCHSVFPHLLLILKHQINLLSKWYGGFSKIYHSLRSR